MVGSSLNAQRQFPSRCVVGSVSCAESESFNTRDACRTMQRRPGSQLVVGVGAGVNGNGAAPQVNRRRVDRDEILIYDIIHRNCQLLALCQTKKLGRGGSTHGCLSHSTLSNRH